MFYYGSGSNVDLGSVLQLLDQTFFNTGRNRPSTSKDEWLMITIGRVYRPCKSTLIRPDVNWVSLLIIVCSCSVCPGSSWCVVQAANLHPVLVAAACFTLPDLYYVCPRVRRLHPGGSVMVSQREPVKVAFRNRAARRIRVQTRSWGLSQGVILRQLRIPWHPYRLRQTPARTFITRQNESISKCLQVCSARDNEERVLKKVHQSQPTSQHSTVDKLQVARTP